MIQVEAIKIALKIASVESFENEKTSETRVTNKLLKKLNGPRMKGTTKKQRRKNPIKGSSCFKRNSDIYLDDGTPVATSRSTHIFYHSQDHSDKSTPDNPPSKQFTTKLIGCMTVTLRNKFIDRPHIPDEVQQRVYRLSGQMSQSAGREGGGIGRRHHAGPPRPSSEGPSSQWPRSRFTEKMVMMAGMDDHERKVVLEFCHLLEKSKQLFNGLRDLPQYGHKQWQSYFGRTFDIYTKLWKFQQQHRTILDTKYGLKRWQIGEIASKIGQLYYHYYLRTSETSYLHEAYSFYAAIRGRAYYSRAAKEDRSDLMVKKLRYYARFIVVCLLLNRMKLVRELVQELDAQIVDYTSTYEPDDQLEWNLVLDEIKAFVKAESAVGVMHSDSNPVILTHRLGPQTSPPVERTPPMCLSLQEILIVGNCADQVKFSELSMDMFRMLQTLEREPRDDPNHLHDASPAGRMPFRPGAYPGAENGAPRRDNPHKYLLHKPTYSQVQVFLASGFRELPANGALLLYLSADGCFSTVKHPEEMGYDLGGVSTCSKKDTEHGKRPTGGKEPHCLYPGDLYPFTRKPLFVVVDSDNSFVFQQIPRYFGQPLMVLMSPQDTPSTLRDIRHGGSLFTLFLHAPLAAFCLICNIGSLAVHHWERCQRYIERFLIEACQLVTRSRCETSVLQFFGDDFLRLLLVRYVFCDVVLNLHRSFRGRQQRPRCHPPLPDAEVLEHPTLHHLVLDLAACLDCRDHFPDSNELA